MKKLILTMLIMVICLLGAVTAGAATDPQINDNANSWRYENGQLKKNLIETGKTRAAATHPDATKIGIDVSKHQGVIDWEKVKEAGVDFVIIRCGYGLDRPEWDDAQFERNADECERLGIPYGVYIYSYANKESDALSEAQHVLRLIEGRKISYPVYFDMEDEKELAKLGTLEEQREKLATFAEIFCSEIEDAGYPAGVYANLNWWNTYLTDDCFDQWYRWVAQYNTECDYVGEYTIWQYTPYGSVDGIEGNVDMNFLIGEPENHGHIHLYLGEWKFATEGHWKECDCGLKGTVSEHEFIWVTDQTATPAENGVRHEECIECGFKQNENSEIEYDYLFGDDLIVALAGMNRYDTAILSADALMQEMKKESFDNIIVASGENYPDALAGSYLAKVKDAPIVLTAPSTDEIMAEYVKYNLAAEGTVYILGGVGAVSETFEKKLADAGINTVRLAGNDRYDTNIEILKGAGVTDESVLVCSGAGFADSLSASAVGLPILLVGNEITEKQQAYLDSLDSDKIYLIGGTGAVSGAVESTLAAGYETERLAGENRYLTSAVVAEKFFPEADTAMLAYAYNFPDGLSGGPLAMMRNAPVLLVDNVNYADAAAYAQKAGVGKIIIMGGETLISEETAALILGVGEE